MSAQQDRLDREMLRSMAASFSSGLAFSFNSQDMAELMQRMSERVDPRPRIDTSNARIAELEAENAQLRDAGKRLADLWDKGRSDRIGPAVRQMRAALDRDRAP